jgi:hypothetical protein
MSGHPFSFIGKACAIKTCEKPVEVGFKFCSRDCAVTWRSLCNLCRERPKQGRRFCGTECSAKHAERVITAALLPDPEPPLSTLLMYSQ